jgi:hypothetical protein
VKHEIKIAPLNYMLIAGGTKTFEVMSDRELIPQKGDVIEFREWDDTPISAAEKKIPKGYTANPPLNFKVGYLLYLSRNEVIVSLLPIKKAKPKKSKK